MTLLHRLLTASAVGAIGLTSMYGAKSSRPTELKGYITDTWCGVNRDTKAPTAACTRECVRSKAAQFAFYSLADGKVYIIQDQAKADPFAGDTVLVKGIVQHTSRHIDTMRGPRDVDTIQLASIEVAK